MTTELIYKDEVYAIQGAVFEVYKTLGNGFTEEVYQQCLERELSMRGIPFCAKKELKIYYKGEAIEKTYIPDLRLPSDAGIAKTREWSRMSLAPISIPRKANYAFENAPKV